jgi:hypothetical protein
MILRSRVCGGTAQLVRTVGSRTTLGSRSAKMVHMEPYLRILIMFFIIRRINTLRLPPDDMLCAVCFSFVDKEPPTKQDKPMRWDARARQRQA